MISTQRCKPGEVLQVTANETDYLMSQNYPGIQNSKLPCFWQLVAENSTGVFVNVLEGEMFISTTEPDEEKPTLQAGRKTLHVPTDTILSWSGGTKGKFLATIENLGEKNAIPKKIIFEVFGTIVMMKMIIVDSFVHKIWL